MAASLHRCTRLRPVHKKNGGISVENAAGSGFPVGLI